jgi:hypothetical protein
LTNHLQKGKRSFRKQKIQTRKFLAERDFSFLENNDDHSRSFRVLNSLLFDPDGLIVWRTVEAIGRLAAIEYKDEPNRVKEFLRRLFWAMNDESGGLCRHAPEAIGEILFNVPDLIEEFGLILASFVDEEPFEVGVRLALARVAPENYKPFMGITDKLSETIASDIVAMKASSLIALNELKIYPEKSAIEELIDCEDTFEVYDFRDGVIKTVRIADLVSEIKNSS